MKIGIMTFWDSKENYGQQLQCYALQKYLRDAGHDAYLIRYNNLGDGNKRTVWEKALKAFNPVKLFKYLLHKVAAAKRTRELDKRSFDDFRNKYIKQSEKIYYSYNELKENPPIADIYIVGSDQVWNPIYFPSIGKQVRAFFLDFGNSSTKRFSYAASFGKEKLDDDIIKIAAPLLQRFNYVTVRENSGIHVCKQCGINNAECVPDPTMLLDANAYRALYKNEQLKKPDKPYCFLYFMCDGDAFNVQNVYDWAKKKNLEVVFVNAHYSQGRWSKYEITHATIPEWIYLLEHAEYVVTNSYHCSVFSILFGKKFCVVPLSRKTSVNRFESLFELFKIGRRYVNNTDFSVLDNDIDWQTIQNIFQYLCRDSKLLNVISELDKNKCLKFQ